LSWRLKALGATVERMAKLWAVGVHGHDPGYRCVAKLEPSAAIVDTVWPFLKMARIPGKSKLAEAIRYAKSRRERARTLPG